ncbi:MAG: hypothetical protein JWP64_5700 [Pseudonocardia sp.]|jgi:hypothetical protein|uniref:hypothetical protein n=1 Tax=Pseudonocardia sp. TaxID=60912 RepID=UPI002605A346|nr:hypothetical protein [Pseudonocardia sp.]MCU1630751.1 hypothetical protein [Pseudonocardia sp.]MDT7698030.1 hypothetical protein [Pseudonocardiales bacterium]
MSGLRVRRSADLAVQVSDAAQNLPLAVLIGAIAGWRAGFFHWAFALLIVASNAVMPVGQFGTLLDIAIGAALGLFMVSVGVAALRMTNREWATGERR